MCNVVMWNLRGIASAGATISEQISGASSTSVSSVSTQTVSTAQTSATSEVTHLGVVGRGVKRVVMNTTTESRPIKKPSIDPSAKRQLAEAGGHVVMAIRNTKAANDLIKKWQENWSGKGLSIF